MGKKLPQRKHPRLEQFDYSSAGAYFITICTYNRRCLLSYIVGRGLAPAEIRYTEYGEIAHRQLISLEERFPFVKVDQYVIMPNHIHAILLLENAVETYPRPTVSDVICAYKSLTTIECKKFSPINKLFQASFYDHVIRGREDYEEISKYIQENPIKWKLDKLYSET